MSHGESLDIALKKPGLIEIELSRDLGGAKVQSRLRFSVDLAPDLLGIVEDLCRSPEPGRSLVLQRGKDNLVAALRVSGQRMLFSIKNERAQGPSEKLEMRLDTAWGLIDLLGDAAPESWSS